MLARDADKVRRASPVIESMLVKPSPPLRRLTEIVRVLRSVVPVTPMTLNVLLAPPPTPSTPGPERRMVTMSPSTSV